EKKGFRKELKKSRISLKLAISMSAILIAYYSYIHISNIKLNNFNENSVGFKNFLTFISYTVSLFQFYILLLKAYIKCPSHPEDRELEPADLYVGLSLGILISIFMTNLVGTIDTFDRHDSSYWLFTDYPFFILLTYTAGAITGHTLFYATVIVQKIISKRR
ncbi:MAG: hypothetical protein ABGW90_05585, partial [Martelella sp.]